MPTMEGLRLELLKYNRKLFALIHRKKLIFTDFTIISNNCWGGEVYEYYHIQKQSPTVGLFIMADDYIKFIRKLPEYLSANLSFISPQSSKWKNASQVKDDKRFGNYPIGLLEIPGESIEIFFLHYHSEDEAKSKWKRRCQRVNWKKLLVKFNDQNGCTESNVRDFINSDYEHKLFFTIKEWPSLSNYIQCHKELLYVHVKQNVHTEHILASYEPFGKMITNYLNNL